MGFKGSAMSQPNTSIKFLNRRLLLKDDALTSKCILLASGYSDKIHSTVHKYC